MVMGVASDNTRTRWGRRRPYLVLGAVLCALWMPLLWVFNREWNLNTIILWMIVFQLGMFLFNTIYNVPYQCLLLEITPSTVERTNVSAMRAYFGKAAGFLMGWVWWLSQLPVFNGADGKPDIIKGAFWVSLGGGVIVLATGLIAAAFCRERYYHAARTQEKIPILKNLKLTFQNRPFVRLVIMAGLFMCWEHTVRRVSHFLFGFITSAEAIKNSRRPSPGSEPPSCFSPAWRRFRFANGPPDATASGPP
jgi:GPH family glycoside/pentoside/hexuronide:cation symporter